jgi:hypothetical protein
MHLKSIHVKNFRALEEIHVDLDSRVSVIVGPNAIGKTTLLEAIRLVKSVVAPRSPNEPTQALLALGAAVPYNPQKIFPATIARDPKRPVEIRCRYKLEAVEIEALAADMPELATEFTLNSTGRNPQNANLNLAFLSSPAGQAALSAAENTLKGVIEGVRKGTQDLHLDLQFDPISSRFRSNDVISATPRGSTSVQPATCHDRFRPMACRSNVA